MRVSVVAIVIAAMAGAPSLHKEEAAASLPPLTIPIRFEMPAAKAAVSPFEKQTGYYQPVAPQPYKRKCGTIATDVCTTDIAVPPGATGEQLYQMAAQAEQQGRKGDALSYLLKSAEKGYARAQSAVGIDYADGKGMQQDLSKAVYYLGLAAAQGNRGAEAKLGEILEDGQGVPRDEGRAIALFRASAAQHDTNAEFALGVDYEFARGVPHNRATAIQYLRQSSVDGHDTYGTELADVLAKAPGSRQFHSFDEVDAFVHPPPPPPKPGECPVLHVYLAGPRAQGQIYLFCACHPGCPYTSPGFEMNCSNRGATPVCS
jgi:hypothetical protein